MCTSANERVTVPRLRSDLFSPSNNSGRILSTRNSHLLRSCSSLTHKQTCTHAHLHCDDGFFVNQRSILIQKLLLNKSWFLSLDIEPLQSFFLIFLPNIFSNLCWNQCDLLQRALKQQQQGSACNSYGSHLATAQTQQPFTQPSDTFAAQATHVHAERFSRMNLRKVSLAYKEAEPTSHSR